jgi:hypothetical protein
MSCRNWLTFVDAGALIERPNEMNIACSAAVSDDRIWGEVAKDIGNGGAEWIQAVAKQDRNGPVSKRSMPGRQLGLGGVLTLLGRSERVNRWQVRGS